MYARFLNTFLDRDMFSFFYIQGDYLLGHPGYGGQNVKYDPKYKLSMAYVRNGLSPEFDDCWSFTALQNALYESIIK